MPAGSLFVDDQRAGQVVLDGVDRIQRGKRILEDQLHLAAVLQGGLARLRLENILAIEENLTACVTWIRRAIMRMVVVLPLPDSPTSATTWPRSNGKGDISTAWTCRGGRRPLQGNVW